jgi:hypothetical protein
MNKIIELKYLKEYNLWVRFNDNSTKVIDFKDYIGNGISAKLLDYEYFKLAKIDNGGGIEWPNGFDFCPNYLKELTSKNEFIEQ